MRAKEEFKSEVETYKEELREWLNGYSKAAAERWETFEVSLTLSNAPGAAHAEAVEVVLELPESVTQATASLEVEAPPDRPTYSPPQPRSLRTSGIGGWASTYPIIPAGPEINLADLVLSRRLQQGWRESSSVRSLTAPRVEVQPGRTVEIAEPLSLRVRGPGGHEVQWTVYSQSLDHPVHGSFELVVPEGDPQRPPFGRMEGILRYPDAPIARGQDGDETEEEENGEFRVPAVRPVRDGDPPLAPPSSGVEDGDSGVLATIQAVSRHWKWEALGLDPSLDGPSSGRVEVRRATPRSPEETP